MANPEVIVLGAGIAGAATAVFLARRGHRVVLFESHEPAHSGGSSHGDGRIIRYTYPEEVYVEMARRAYTAWADLETAAGESLVETTGSWECGPAGSLPLADLEASFERDGIAYDRLTPAESAERFPHFHLPEGSFALYQEHGGIVRAERAVRAFCRLAEQAGAQIVYQPIVAIEPSAEGVEVVAQDGNRWRASSVVATLGGWSGPMLSTLDLSLPLHVTREQVTYFRVRDGVEVDHGISGMPTFIDYHDPEQPFYGLPIIEVPGVKLGWHHSGPTFSPDDEEAVDGEILAKQQRYVRERLPGLDPEPIHITRCLYTNTPDYHFVLDHHPHHPRVVVGTGFSGHGFKFGPVLGEILASLALGEEPPVDLETFRIARFDGELQRRRSA